MVTYRFRRIEDGGYSVQLGDGSDLCHIWPTEDGQWRACAYTGRTVGYAPTRRLAADLIRTHGTPDDPAILLQEYAVAMDEQAAAEDRVAMCTDRRASALAQLHAQGWPLSWIAEQVGLSRARVQQLVERGRGV